MKEIQEDPTVSLAFSSTASGPFCCTAFSSPVSASPRASTSAEGSPDDACRSSPAWVDSPPAGRSGRADVVAVVGLGSTGVTGVAATSLGLLDSRFFSSVLKNTLIVVRSALCGLQSSADRGECSQTGQEAGSVDWQLSQMACSQHGRRKALMASLLQMAHRSFAGISSCGRELKLEVSYAREAPEKKT